jgi:chromosome segregation ATPase
VGGVLLWLRQAPPQKIVNLPRAHVFVQPTHHDGSTQTTADDAAELQSLHAQVAALTLTLSNERDVLNQIDASHERVHRRDMERLQEVAQHNEELQLQLHAAEMEHNQWLRTVHHEQLNAVRAECEQQLHAAHAERDEQVGGAHAELQTALVELKRVSEICRELQADLRAAHAANAEQVERMQSTIKSRLGQEAASATAKLAYQEQDWQTKLERQHQVWQQEKERLEARIEQLEYQLSSEQPYQSNKKRGYSA